MPCQPVNKLSLELSIPSKLKSTECTKRHKVERNLVLRCHREKWFSVTILNIIGLKLAYFGLFRNDQTFCAVSWFFWNSPIWVHDVEWSFIFFGPQYFVIIKLVLTNYIANFYYRIVEVSSTNSVYQLEISNRVL